MARSSVYLLFRRNRNLRLDPVGLQVVVQLFEVLEAAAHRPRELTVRHFDSVPVVPVYNMI